MVSFFLLIVYFMLMNLLTTYYFSYCCFISTVETTVFSKNELSKKEGGQEMLLTWVFWIRATVSERGKKSLQAC